MVTYRKLYGHRSHPWTFKEAINDTLDADFDEYGQIEILKSELNNVRKLLVELADMVLTDAQKRSLIEHRFAER